MKAKELPRQKGKFTGFHAGSSGRKFAKATMLLPSWAVRLRRRPAAAKQHPAVHRQARSGVEQVADKGRSAVSAAVNGIANFAKGNAHALVVVGVFLLLLLLVMSAFSSCSILFSGTTHVSGQTIYTAEDRDIRGAEQDYKKLEKELDKKIKRTPQDHPGYNEYQYHLDPIEHDPWQLTSFLTTLYDDYTRSEVQGKLKEIFKKQYKLTTWVEVQIRYRTVWVISPAGIPVPTQVPYEYKIFHTKLENRGLEVVIREELTEDQWQRYAAAFLGVLALVGLTAGGGIYAFMKQKQKKQAEKEALDPDADYTEDKGDFEIPMEDEPEEPGEEDNAEE